MPGEMKVEDSVSPEQKKPTQDDPEKAMLDKEVAALEEFQKRLATSKKAAEEQLEKMLKDCEEEIKKRNDFIKKVKEALDNEADPKERAVLEKMISDTEKLIANLEKKIQPQIVAARNETTEKFVKEIEKIDGGIKEGRSFVPLPKPSGPPVIVTERPATEVDKYCVKMDLLRKSVASGVTAIHATLKDKIKSITSLFSKNKESFKTVENSFERYLERKKKFSIERKP